MLQIGPYKIATPLVLAPMAGITDAPFRALCRKMGAGLAVAEMVTADQSLWHTQKSRLRLPHQDEQEPRMIQIAGGDPQMLADAARANVELGAQIIDINMGCPAKKVCKKAAGSALLKDEKLVAEILEAVVQAVEVPVTLKIRTGWSAKYKNAVTIGKLAEASGIQALTLHGRTREDRFKGEAEYETLAEVSQALSIPVIANGDIDSPQKAEWIFNNTQAAAVMIGRAAQGRPWIFSQIKSWLEEGVRLPDPDPISVQQLIGEHLQGLYATYGDFMGVRIARKHFGWYLQQAGLAQWRKTFNLLETSEEQLELLADIFQPTTTSLAITA
ncbi:tRNA-dihydrouridine synthase B [Marinospirillum celere]|uniref:tRNA-dihydrouridine synthase B n=1 Tax=Marinospirillum celere TaxID=1122252 RepID=A0A1I1E206_9GAMM|nr:tRNA dihydrouridine synthase DusB [Marinospirillum celere]SFB81235.1 tRNA-dihydrouridine synthase B [Marinospirillum celere]